MLGDKGCDADERVIEPLQAQGKTVVIPPRRNRKHLREYDKELYKARHLIENFFVRLKRYRAMVTRYDKRGILSAQFILLLQSFGSIDDTP